MTMYAWFVLSFGKQDLAGAVVWEPELPRLLSRKCDRSNLSPKTKRSLFLMNEKKKKNDKISDDETKSPEKHIASKRCVFSLNFVDDPKLRLS